MKNTCDMFLNKHFTVLVGSALLISAHAFSVRAEGLGEYVSFQVGAHSNFLQPDVVAAQTGGSVSQSNVTFEKPSSAINANISAHIWKGAFAKLSYTDIGEIKVNFSNTVTPPTTYKQEVYSGRIGYQYPYNPYGAHVYGEIGSSFITLKSSAENVRRGSEYTLSSAVGVDYFWRSGIGVSLDYERLSGDTQVLALNVGYKLNLKTESTTLKDDKSLEPSNSSVLELSFEDEKSSVSSLPKSFSQGLEPTSTDVLADEDGDGVSDAEDYCSGTAPGASVNAIGCVVLFQGVEFTDDSDVDIKRLLPKEKQKSAKVEKQEAKALISYLSVPDLGEFSTTKPETDPTAAIAFPSGTAKSTENTVDVETSIIQFDRNSSKLLSDEKSKLSKWIKQLKQSKDEKVRLRVYTNQGGDIHYNVWIANRQANSVRDYLIEKGVNKKQIIFNELSVLDSFGIDPNRSDRVYISQ